MPYAGQNAGHEHILEIDSEALKFFSDNLGVLSGRWWQTGSRQ